MKRKPLYFFTSDEVSVIERLAGRLGGGALGGGECTRGMARLSNRSSQGISADSGLSLIS